MPHSYPLSFKIAAVNKMRNRPANRTVLQVSIELGVHWTTLYKWDNQLPYKITSSDTAKQAVLLRLEQVKSRINYAETTLREMSCEAERLTLALSVLS